MIISTEQWRGKGVYLLRAEQYARTMASAFEKKDWDPCVGNAIHTVISAQDAFCIHMKSQRYKGTDHREAAEFFKNVFQSEEHKKASQRLSDLIKIKTDAEYGDRNFSEKEAIQAKTTAERFLAYVKSSLI